MKEVEKTLQEQGIDPGAQAGRILQRITENGWTIERILTLPSDTTLYSGHTEPTTVERERPVYCG